MANRTLAGLHIAYQRKRYTTAPAGNERGYRVAAERSAAQARSAEGPCALCLVARSGAAKNDFT
ncbi:hypothetical protein GCM10009413_08060 [Tatumella punctata]